MSKSQSQKISPATHSEFSPILGMTVPLSAEELSRSEYVGGRLWAELHGLLESVPAAHRASRALSRYLRVDANVAQRVLAVIKAGPNGLAALAKVTGSKTLRVFVTAARKRGEKRLDVEPAIAAIVELERLGEELAGTHTRLLSRLRATPATVDPSHGDTDRAERLRRAMFNSASELTATSCDMQLALSLVRSSPGDASHVELIAISGFIGLSIGNGGLPVVLESSMHSSGERLPEAMMPRQLDPDFANPSKFRTLITGFCGVLLPRVTVHQRGRTMAHTIDAPEGVGAGKFDVVFGHRAPLLPSPIGTQTPAVSLGTRIRTPARRMVYILLLHRELAARCRPTANVFFWTPTSAAGVIETWYERLPQRVELERLGPIPEGTRSDAWARLESLTAHLFSQAGWPPADFEGFRMDVRFPLWGAGYHIALDFGQAHAE
mgnify:CR=1 FL=1